MKKITLLLVFCISGTFAFTQVVEQTYHFQQPELISQQGYYVISFDNTFNTARHGEPVLPYQDIKLLLPPGYVAESITLEKSGLKEIDGEFELFPQQPSRPVSSEWDHEFLKNERLYQSYSPYPNKQYGQLTTEFMNGYGIALGTFTPIQYIPAKCKVSYHETVTIKIKLKKDKSALFAQKNLISTEKTKNDIVAFCQNPEEIQAYPEVKNRSGDYQLLLITTGEFKDSFEDLVDLYKHRGIKTEIVTVSQIEANSGGNDTQEKIRNHIIQDYQQHSIEYVMLAGDEELIPSRGFYCYVQSGSGVTDYNIPADLYYCALDGTWNDDGDNRWGEIGEDDLLPEVSLARLPFSNQTELDNMLNKIMSYQNSPVTGELDQPILVGEHLWDDPLSYAADYLAMLIGYHDDNGYITNGIPEDDNYRTLYDKDATWSKYDLLDEINTGTSFIHHFGHSGTYYNMRFTNSDITNENFYNIDGETHNFIPVFTEGCTCGDFTANDCIAEQMLKIEKFSVGGAFNSRYGWFNEGQTDGPSTHLHREFVDALYNDKRSRIAEAHKIMKTETAPFVNAPGQWEEGALRWNFYDCNILGDPAMMVWTAEPVEIDVDYPSNIHISSGSFSVSVTIGGQPVNDFSCVLLFDNEICGVGSTNETGNTTINFDESALEEGDAQLVVSGYNCLPQYYNISLVSGINDINDLAELSIYPNPASDMIFIKNDNPERKITNIAMYDALGKAVKTMDFPDVQNLQTTISLNVNDLLNGLYFIEFKSNNDRLVRKVVINK